MTVKINESGSHDAAFGIDLFRGVYIFGADDDPVFHRESHTASSPRYGSSTRAAADQIIYFFPMDTSICLYLLVSAFELNVII